MKKLPLRVIGHLFLFSLFFYSQKGAAQSQSNPEAHTHGIAHMTLLYETGQLLIELETPATNMLGFEHSPQNPEQWQRLSRLKKNLDNPNKIIHLQPDCTAKSAKVELPFQESAEEHSAHDHETHDGHQSHNYNMHKDIHLSYEWQCYGLAPPTITFRVFSSYPKFETIQVQWVANGRQGAAILNKKNASLEIKP